MVKILSKFQDFKSPVFDHALIVSRATALMVRSAKIQIQNTFESGDVSAMQPAGKSGKFPANHRPGLSIKRRI